MPAAQESKEQGKNPVTGSIDFFKDAWAELKKVHHPTRQETIQATLIVFAMVFVMAFLLGGIDLIWSFVMRQVLTGGN